MADRAWGPCYLGREQQTQGRGQETDRVAYDAVERTGVVSEATVRRLRDLEVKHASICEPRFARQGSRTHEYQMRGNTVLRHF